MYYILNQVLASHVLTYRTNLAIKVIEESTSFRRYMLEAWQTGMRAPCAEYIGCPWLYAGMLDLDKMSLLYIYTHRSIMSDGLRTRV
jgi:hypothetical protein